MPELPEIASRAREMNQHLAGKTISGIEIIQPKCLNLTAPEFQAALNGATIRSVTYRGKWILAVTTRGWLLFNLGMGGEILLVRRDRLPEKRRLVFDFTDGSCLSVNFWWFGYAHYSLSDPFSSLPMLQKLGPNALDLSLAEFQELLSGQKTALKAFLLDQSRIAGIGNAYIHDILFLARLHPMRKLNTLSAAEIEQLYQAIHLGLQPSLDKNGAFYEVSLLGEKGGFQMEDILIGYRENQPCPNCSTPIVKIKTGSTSSFICPNCQK